MKAADSLLSIISLSVIFTGLLFAASNEWGFLQSHKRIDFYHHVFYSSVAIPRDAECFDDFLKAFPPPPGTASTLVSGIAPRTLTMGNTGDDVWSSVRYSINGTTTGIVATQPDVEKWAYKTAGTKIGLLFSFSGFLLGVVKHVLSRGTAKGVQPNAAPSSQLASQLPSSPEIQASSPQSTPLSDGRG